MLFSKNIADILAFAIHWKELFISCSTTNQTRQEAVNANIHARAAYTCRLVAADADVSYRLLVVKKIVSVYNCAPGCLVKCRL